MRDEGKALPIEVVPDIDDTDQCRGWPMVLVRIDRSSVQELAHRLDRATTQASASTNNKNRKRPRSPRTGAAKSRT